MLNEMELVRSAIYDTTYLKPRRSTWKNWAEAVAGVALIGFLAYALILFAASSLK